MTAPGSIAEGAGSQARAGPLAPARIRLYWLCAHSSMDVPHLHADSWRRLAVREDVNQHPEWGSDQTTAGPTTASEGGEVAREEEDQRVRD